MKAFTIILSCLMITPSMNSIAQTNNLEQDKVSKIEVKSCSERLRNLVNKNSGKAKDVAGVSGTAAGLGGIIIGVPSGVIHSRNTSVDGDIAPGAGLKGAAITAGVIFAIGGGIAGVMAFVQKHRENILEIFDGAANGGNGKTKKLWKITKKKMSKIDKDAFKNVTYKQFLEEIYKADISGRACEFEDVPERKEIASVLIEQIELENEDKIGEKMEVSKNSQVEMNRNIHIEKSNSGDSIENSQRLNDIRGN
jgi:hypothetical protein